jgi:hypothetical protein
MFLLGIWVIVIIALIIVFFVLIIRRVIKLKVSILSRLTLTKYPDLLNPPTDPGSLYKINNIRVPDELRGTLFPKEANISGTNISSEIFAPSWELMKNHLVHIFSVIGYWSRQSDVSYITRKCSERAPVTLINKKGKEVYPIADLLCFSGVTIENEIGEVEKSETEDGATELKIEPSRVVIALRNTDLNVIFRLFLNIVPVVPREYSPGPISSNALIQMEFISYWAPIPKVIRAIIPGNLEKTVYYLSRVVSFNEFLRNSVSSTDVTLRRIYGLRIGETHISDSVPPKKL